MSLADQGKGPNYWRWVIIGAPVRRKSEPGRRGENRTMQIAKERGHWLRRDWLYCTLVHITVKSSFVPVKETPFVAGRCALFLAAYHMRTTAYGFPQNTPDWFAELGDAA
jgi:hypothetical protein